MSDFASVTVMGIAMGFTLGFDTLMTPRMTSMSDKFKWRKLVKLWVTIEKRFANVGGKRAEEILNALGLTLFNAFYQVFSTQFWLPIAAGKINLDEDKNDDEKATIK